VIGMNCLYTSDYGPPDPGFDATVEGGVLLRGFEGHRAVLAQAQNRGQFEAMKRQLLRGEPVQWCDQGYGWTYQTRVDAMFDVILVAVVLPWFVWRVVRPALRSMRRRVQDGAAAARATP
jgi:hypothetical protein